MTILNSQFDVIGHDPHPNARAGLMTVLPVDGAPNPYSSLPASGTPVAGDIPAGAIVVMNSSGNAVMADNDNALTDAPALMFVTVDGDKDYDGAFVHKITCIQGGAEYRLDTNNFVAGSYTPGNALTCGDTTSTSVGQFRVATAGEQIYGFVGSEGFDASKNTLHVIIPQGVCPAVPTP